MCFEANRQTHISIRLRNRVDHIEREQKNKFKFNALSRCQISFGKASFNQISRGCEPNYKYATDVWYDEVKDYTDYNQGADLIMQGDPPVGHFTQGNSIQQLLLFGLQYCVLQESQYSNRIFQ